MANGFANGEYPNMPAWPSGYPGLAPGAMVRPLKNIYNRRTKIMNLYITLKVIKFWHHIWKSYIWHERACFSVVLWKVHQFWRFDSLLMALRSLINFENKSFFSLRGQVSVSNLIGGDFLTFFPSIVNFLTPIFKEYFKIITVETSQISFVLCPSQTLTVKNLKNFRLAQEICYADFQDYTLVP